VAATWETVCAIAAALPATELDPPPRDERDLLVASDPDTFRQRNGHRSPALHHRWRIVFPA